MKITFFVECITIPSAISRYTMLYYWLLHTYKIYNIAITRNRCRNRYTLSKKSYLHWRGIATYLYSQLTKISLISRNTNFPRKNLIYLMQVYTFRSNQTKLENPKSSLPLKKFIVHFLTTLNPRKWKVR